MTVFKKWKLDWWQIAILKICLLCAGILLGVYFTSFFAGIAALLWIIFVATALYLFYTMFTSK